MTVGRVADKADIVLPVATGQLAAVAIMLSSTHGRRQGGHAVSGAHARLEKKGGSLLVTDLDSTNGTYINERRLNPGFPASVDPGSLLIFGLLHACISNRRPSLAVSSCIDRSVSVSTAGDIHLAMFRVRKTVVVEAPSTSTEEAEGAQQEATAAEDI